MGVGEGGKGATVPHFSDTGAGAPFFLRKEPLLTIFPMGSGYTLLPMGGHMAPHRKIPLTCPLVIKPGRIPKGDQKFTMNPNLSHLWSWWRHSDVITMMTSSKSVKIGFRHNFSTKYPLMTFDPSFFMFWSPLSEKIQIIGVRGQKSADISIFDHQNRWWRHSDVTWRHDVMCRIFLFQIIPLTNI